MKTSGSKTLLVLLLVIVFVLTGAVAAKPAQPQQAVAEEATPTVVPWVLGSTVATPVADYAPFERAIELNAQRTAEKMFADGIDTTRELEASGLTGRAYEILKEKISTKEAQEAAARAAARKRQVAVRSATPAESAPVAGQWTGSHAEWDAIARQTLFKGGCSDYEVELMMAIHHGEGGPNSVNPNGHYGGWQLKTSMAAGNPWWDPSWSTARALQYVLGRYGSVQAAYDHKKSTGWY